MPLRAVLDVVLAHATTVQIRTQSKTDRVISSAVDLLLHGHVEGCTDDESFCCRYITSGA